MIDKLLDLLNASEGSDEVAIYVRSPSKETQEALLTETQSVQTEPSSAYPAVVEPTAVPVQSEHLASFAAAVCDDPENRFAAHIVEGMSRLRRS